MVTHFDVDDTNRCWFVQLDMAYYLLACTLHCGVTHLIFKLCFEFVIVHPLSTADYIQPLITATRRQIKLNNLSEFLNRNIQFELLRYNYLVCTRSSCSEANNAVNKS